MTHPYTDLPPRAFWRTGVVETDKARLPGLYRPSFEIDATTRVATAGSCFAQHIGRTLRERGCTVLDAEPAPKLMTDEVAQTFGYRLFSGRYGNIYTARQMRQLLEDVTRGHVDPRFVWERDDAFFDAFRPTVEPEGLETVDEVLLHRDYHLERTAQMLREAEVFVFTLGLTEAWADRATGRVFPMCPGVVAGEFDADEHVFHNTRYPELRADLDRIRRLLRRFNPAMKMLLTVSPVPLTATAADEHVLTATTWSKAVLRAAAGDFAADTDDVAYFPSFEIVTSHATGGPWYAPNERTVRPDAVARVMSLFLAAHGIGDPPEALDPPPPGDDETEDPADDAVCDELLLQAFAK